MKILLVILHADSSRGGAEAYTVTLFHKLLEAGHDTRLAAATFEAAVPRDRRVPLDYHGFTRTGRYTRLLRSLDRHLHGGEYDIVHAMLPVRRCDIYHPHAGLEAIGWRGVSLSQRIGNVRRREFVAVERRLLSGDRPPVTLCLSNRVRDEAAKLFGRPDRFVTLYSGVDDTRFRPASPPHSWRGQDAHATNTAAPICLFVGQNFARKGLDIAIAAVAAHPTAILRVVGGDDPRPFAGIVRQSDVGDRVQFIGATRDVATQLHQADALLLPARQEPFGMVAIEAMLCGVPPVVSSHCGVAEIIRDGVDGRVVDGLAIEAWTAAVHDVLARRGSLSAACVARRDELSYSHHLRTLLDLYERTAAERRR